MVPRSALASGSTGSADRGSDHKRYSVAARSSIKPRGLRRHAGAVPCGTGYARYPQAGRDDSRFPRKGEIWPTRCPRLERSPFQKTQIVCEALVARARQREFGPRPPPFDHPRRMAAAAQRRPDERGGGYGVEGWCS